MQSYDERFYSGQAAGSQQSADLVVPIIIDLFKPESVADIGCGLGTWLSAYQANGVRDILGVDGDYVNRDELRIETDHFLPHDLTRPLNLGRRFDLVQTLEVAEHVRPDAAGTFVESLVKHSDVILFGAAIPFQGGTNHMNEQFIDYWTDLFALHDYRLVDCIRHRIWNNKDVEAWYRQNTVIFAKNDYISSHPWLNDEFNNPCNDMHSLVHPELYTMRINGLLEVLFGLALQIQNSGNSEAAKMLLQIILSYDYGSSKALNAAGRLAAMNGDLDEAIEYLSRATNYQPNSPDYRCDLAETYIAAARFSDARTSFQSALAINPGLDRARNGLNRLLSEGK